MARSNRPPVPTLPPSVEEAYRRKCIQLRSRMREVEEANDQYRLRRERLVRGIRKMRLERAILLETLAKRMNKKGPTVLEGLAANGASGTNAFDDPETDDSTESPPTPQERPMRIKRPHRRAEDFEGEMPARGQGMIPGEGALGEFVGEREEEERRAMEAEGDERDSRMGDESGVIGREHEGLATPAQGMNRYAPPSQQGDGDADESMMQD